MSCERMIQHKLESLQTAASRVVAGIERRGLLAEGEQRCDVFVVVFRKHCFFFALLLLLTREFFFLWR